jgi:hypothetical protein
MREEFKKYDMESKLTKCIFPFLNIRRVSQIINPSSKHPSQISVAKRNRKLLFAWGASLPSAQPSSGLKKTQYIVTSGVMNEYNLRGEWSQLGHVMLV